MTPSVAVKPSGRHLALIAALYFLGAKLGMLSVMPEGNALFWPANAVTLAALLRFNGARLPAIGLVVLAAEIAADVPRFSLLEALLFGMINFAEAAGAFLLLRKVRFDSAFTAVSDVWKFVVAAIAASGCAAFLGAAVYSGFRGGETTYFEFFRIWWFGDAVGLIVVTPLLLGFAPFRTMTFDPPSRWSRADLVMGLAAIVAVVGIWSGAAPLFGTLFFVLYVAWRAAPRWAAAAVALVAFFVVLVLASGRQPFDELAARDAVPDRHHRGDSGEQHGEVGARPARRRVEGHGAERREAEQQRRHHDEADAIAEPPDAHELEVGRLRAAEGAVDRRAEQCRTSRRGNGGDHEFPDVGDRGESGVEPQPAQQQKRTGGLGKVDHAEEQRLHHAEPRHVGRDFGRQHHQADRRQHRAVEAHQRGERHRVGRPEKCVAFRHHGQHAELRAGEVQRADQR